MWKIIQLCSLFQFNLHKAVKHKQKPLSFLEEGNGIVKLRVFTNLEESLELESGFNLPEVVLVETSRLVAIKLTAAVAFTPEGE